MPTVHRHPAPVLRCLAAVTLAWVGHGSALAAASPVNLALTGTASQSSTYPGGDAWKAIDGNRDTRWGMGSVQHTGASPGEWWAVALAQPAWIGELLVFNGDAYSWGDRINGFRVDLYSGSQVAWTSGNVAVFVPDVTAPNVSGMRFTLPTATWGDRVQVTKTATNYLHMAEVEVWSATPVPEPQTWALMAGGLAGLATLARRRAAR